MLNMAWSSIASTASAFSRTSLAPPHFLTCFTSLNFPASRSRPAAQVAVSCLATHFLRATPSVTVAANLASLVEPAWGQCSEKSLVHLPVYFRELDKFTRSFFSRLQHRGGLLQYMLESPPYLQSERSWKDVARVTPFFYESLVFLSTLGASAGGTNFTRLCL